MISVCIATYNGAFYIEEQLDSILPQLGQEDEIILTDDGSTDETLSILKKYQQKDSRVKLFNGPGKGVVANFNYAISKSSGEVIFLADQDDVWLPEKVLTIMNFFAEHPKIELVISDLTIVNEKLEIIEPSYFSFRGVKLGFLRNLIRNGYIGAGMAFRSTLKKEALPIPAKIPMHDMWLGLIADMQKKSAIVPQKLTLYRRHEFNASQIKTKASFYQMLKWRVSISCSLIQRSLRKK